ncbi:DUF3958 family protein [Enterococcus rivorum]|uniref:Uncharacterized protein n=1 Tax=Enterococcus rivorum TaxID=762845 RepID=A0A1E5KWS8_9ENTE|nr:DUF3958 family protein [Enterococcus rivorum]MBP2097336.1 hypothetical protein [Enterococcus rivorum]OEH82317.1 hypothetical protein BCR26_02475 [Enterococcus rivorum]
MEEQLIRRKLWDNAEAQDENSYNIRLQEENITQLESIYTQQNQFFNELQGKWQEHELGSYLAEARDELIYCQQKSLALVTDEMDELVSQKRQLMDQEEQFSNELHTFLATPSDKKEESNHVD